MSLKDPVTVYANRVAAGKVPCGRLHRLAAERHVRDLDEQAKRGIWFDRKAALDAIEFFGHLRHFKGEWAGQPITLETWQQFIVGACWGWKHAHDHSRRRFRTAFIECPRGQGKSTLAGGLGLKGAFFDGEQAAEAYCAATKREQSKIVHEVARRMVLAAPALKSRLNVGAANIHRVSDGSKFEPLGADENTLDGLRASIIIADEVHAHRNSNVIDVLTTGSNTRRQPFTLEITSAGVGQHNVWFSHREYSTRVLQGVIDDETWFAFIAAADPEDDWTAESTWIKANPNFGISVKPEYLRDECKKAVAMPIFQNAFRRLHCGQPTEQIDRAIDMTQWDACQTAIDWNQYAGRTAYLGLDLASTTDLACAIWLFEEPDGSVAVLPRFWVPQEQAEQRSARDHVPYQQWIARGYLTATPGNVIDYDAIRRDLNADGDRFALKEAGYDPWNALQLATQLTGDGFVMTQVRQGYRTMSEPTKHLLALIASRKLRHDGHPVLRWMASNMVTRTDPAGNVAPDKSKATEKIDGVVALIIGLSRAIVQEPPFVSIYESRGALSFSL